MITVASFEAYNYVATTYIVKLVLLTYIIRLSVMTTTKLSDGHIASYAWLLPSVIHDYFHYNSYQTHILK